MRPKVWRVPLRLGPRSHSVLVSAAGAPLLASYLARSRRSWLVVTDSNVHAALWAKTARALAAAGVPVGPPLLVRPGERGKTLVTLQALLGAFLRRGLDRQSGIVALGGGVVTDLAGFAAATYMRGIAWVAAPTTLLGMVDAAIGGKVGANLLRTKNAVGAFHQPEAVLVGTDFLRTLPERERRSGLAEVVKYGMIADRRLFRALEGGLRSGPDADARLVLRCCRIKARYVETDPEERGARAALNFGHTVGHALEAQPVLGLTHGEAVGLGMIVACAVAEELGVAEQAQRQRLARLLGRLGLPTRLEVAPVWPRRLASLRRDKKARGGVLRFVLTPRLGKVSVGHAVAPELLKRALATIAPAPRAGRGRMARSGAWTRSR